MGLLWAFCHSYNSLVFSSSFNLKLFCVAFKHISPSTNSKAKNSACCTTTPLPCGGWAQQWCQRERREKAALYLPHGCLSLLLMVAWSIWHHTLWMDYCACTAMHHGRRSLGVTNVKEIKKAAVLPKKYLQICYLCYTLRQVQRCPQGTLFSLTETVQLSKNCGENQNKA